MNNDPIPFLEFPKIYRLSREVIVTEKIDGTSGTIYIGEAGEFLIGSRNRWITPEDDNYGFARWCMERKEALLTLGPGWHRGEFWGGGIQRGYGLRGSDKRFSMFNVARWCEHGQVPRRIETADPLVEKYQEMLPVCVELVPVLYRGLFTTEACEHALEHLRINGSVAVSGYGRPEGIVIYHVAGNVSFKKTAEKDDEWKGKAK